MKHVYSHFLRFTVSSDCRSVLCPDHLSPENPSSGFTTPSQIIKFVLEDYTLTWPNHISTITASLEKAEDRNKTIALIFGHPLKKSQELDVHTYDTAYTKIKSRIHHPTFFIPIKPSLIFYQNRRFQITEL